MNYLNLPYPWIKEAIKHIGLKEIPGPKHNLVILGWLSELKAWWKEDETPWCSTYISHCFRTSGMNIPKNWMRAKDYSLDWGIKLTAPIPGCVVVFERTGGGHVGFVIGKTKTDQLVVLGGNQSNMVNLMKFDTNRVVGYYWPRDFDIPHIFASIPVIEIAGNTSVNEA